MLSIGYKHRRCIYMKGRESCIGSSNIRSLLLTKNREDKQCVNIQVGHHKAGTLHSVSRTHTRLNPDYRAHSTPKHLLRVCYYSVQCHNRSRECTDTHHNINIPSTFDQVVLPVIWLVLPAIWLFLPPVHAVLLAVPSCHGLTVLVYPLSLPRSNTRRCM